MLKRNQKEELVKNLSDEVKSSKTIIFVDYKGLGVNDMNELRKKLREAEVSFQVVKKSLITIALKNVGKDKNLKEVEGQIALAIGKDEVTGAKILSEFAKKNENLKILSGFLDSEELSIERVAELAKLPSKEELLAKFVSTLNAPISGLVNVLAGNIRGLVTVLKSISEAK